MARPCWLKKTQLVVRLKVDRETKSMWEERGWKLSYRKRREEGEKIFMCSERRYGEVGAKDTDVEDRKMWRKMIRCGYL